MQLRMKALHEAGEAEELSRIDYPRIGLLSAGHLTNDMYGNLLTSLVPYLVLAGLVTKTIAGLVLLVYLAGSSVLQPFFGLLADRSGRRGFAIVGPLWVGGAACLVGLTTSTAMIFVLAAVAGLGTAAFHPQAATMVNALSPRGKGWSMSLFSMGGNIGFAIGPILAAGVALLGLHWSPLAIVPGLIVTVPLALFVPAAAHHHSVPGAEKLTHAAGKSWRPLALIVSVIATRSAAQYSLIIFLPLYFSARGLPAELGSLSAFVLSVAGALSGLLGGHLSDLYGRRPVVVLSLVLAAPLLLAALLVRGPLTWPLLVLAGAALLASSSVTVVQGQELLPAHTGVASGLTLGIGFGLSGVIASSLTILSDHIGVTNATLLVPALPLLGAVLAVFVVRQHASNYLQPAP